MKPQADSCRNPPRPLPSSVHSSRPFRASGPSSALSPSPMSSSRSVTGSCCLQMRSTSVHALVQPHLWPAGPLPAPVPNAIPHAAVSDPWKVKAALGLVSHPAVPGWLGGSCRPGDMICPFLSGLPSPLPSCVLCFLEHPSMSVPWACPGFPCGSLPPGLCSNVTCHQDLLAEPSRARQQPLLPAQNV